MSTQAGWYADAQGVERWWDGQRWTEHTRSAAMPQTPSEGWYPDPELRGVDRWWDGVAWTDTLRNTPENVRVAGDPVPPGWRPDPDLTGIDRWWDGQQWTDQRRNRPQDR